MDQNEYMNHSLMYPPGYQLPPDPITNRFIYFKQDFVQPLSNGGKVHVNPHFKKNTTVYLNPQFSSKVHVNPNHLCTPTIAPPHVVKPKIHINPNIQIRPNIHVNPNILKTAPPPPPPPPKPQPRKEEVNNGNRNSKFIFTRTKLVRVPSESQRKRRNSLHTKYKIVRSSGKSDASSSFKVDKRIRKKYLYINRFLSISVMAKNVLLKQNPILKRTGFVNINGILYKKSPNSLKKAPSSLKKESPKAATSKYKYVKRTSTSSGSKVRVGEGRRSLVKQFKIIRSKKGTKVVNKKLLRKCNIPCQVYRRSGKCRGKDNGKCFRLHDPNQIVLCTRFLQGACLNANCLLSHKVSHEKLPTCKYYLEGMCSREDCPYAHVKISSKAEVCRDFLEGFCRSGAQCEKRHQFLCPDYEKNKTCPKKRCPYPHGTVRSQLIKKTRTSLVAKKCFVKKKIVQTTSAVETKDAAPPPPPLPNNRYYDDQDSDSKLGPDACQVAMGRPKLGSLPAFIPLFKEET